MQALSRSARGLGLLVGLLAVFLALLSYQADRSRSLATARGAVISVASPFQRLFSLATSGIDEAVTGFSRAFGAAERAEELEDHVAELQREIRRLREADVENRRLRALLDLRSRLDGSGTAANVIGRDLAHRYETVTLNRGGMDGVEVDSPVLSPDGALVGRVVQTGPLTSIVQLLTGPLSGVGARLADSRATGLAAGNDGPVLELRYVDTETPVREEERVVTSGEDGIYPPAIEIGTVLSFSAGSPVPGTPRIPLTREETALFWEIRVAPSVDVMSLEGVLVLPPLTASRAIGPPEEGSPGDEPDDEGTDEPPPDDGDTDPAAATSGPPSPPPSR